MAFVFPSTHFPQLDKTSDISDPQIPQPEQYGPPLGFALLSAEDENDAYDYFWHSLLSHNFSFRPEGGEIEKKRMEIVYDIENDEYVRIGCEFPHKAKGGESNIWRIYNIARKVEDDWNMLYIARLHLDDNHQHGLIEWRFDLTKSNLKVKELKLRIPYRNFRDGKVAVSVCSVDDYTVLLDTNTLKTVHRAKGWTDFIIRVELSGKELAYCWQNAQILRQPLNFNNSAFGFHVVIDLEDNIS